MAQTIEHTDHVTQTFHQPVMKTKTKRKKRHWFSLPVRISLGLVFAAIIPLFLTLAFTYLVTRPALIDQYKTAMQSDASTRVQLINNYMRERVSDIQTITRVPSLQSFMVLPPDTPLPEVQDATIHATYSLVAGTLRVKNYEVWAVFNAQGKQLLAYSPQKNSPFVNKPVPPQELAAVTSGKTFISPVSYSPDVNKAIINFYAPITDQDIIAPGTQPKLIGFMRTTLNLDYIWNDIVQNDQGNNGTGSYAFILDENGIRIADTYANERFTSVAPLPTSVQQQITQEARFGTNSAVPVKADTDLAQHLHDHGVTTTFQAKPAGRNGDDFQVVRYATDSTLLPWNYYVLSPIQAVTSLATQELMITALIVIGAALIVAFIGFFAGRSLTRPIMSAVANLQANSQSLSMLATNQQDAASEQVWVVESSQTGLQSVQYYTDASKIALQRLDEAATELIQFWRQRDAAHIEKKLRQIIKATKYLENATGYQDASNQKLATALKVAIQVTEQLNNGATSATEAATQLEEVVSDLRNVVGR
jgi:methyl-accepting chemotaxis protein